ncbi:MAG: hypothetical protein M3094_02485, partial [Actinomycetia bacterium]|nr:hypothetical protein [Actinomycetes bacterium]
RRDIVVVSGADAFTYLQTQLTQDVVALGPGASTWSFILTPKSEIEELVRVTRLRDVAVLDVASGRGPALRGRLDGLLFRMEVIFEEATWQGVAWRGDGAREVEVDAPVVAALPWDSAEATDVLGPDVAAPPDMSSLSAEELEALRIEAGWPAESEIDGAATPVMTGIVEHTVSFAKGCYTGQEFVARVQSRGATPPRRLVRVSFTAGDPLIPGTEITIGDEVVGTVTSSVASAGIGLAYLKRSVTAPADAVCGGVPVGLHEVVAG